MMEPTTAQINAGVAAAHAFVRTMTSFDVTSLISSDKFEEAITAILSAALNAETSLPNQPLAP
jgi:hypothetical protein